MPSDSLDFWGLCWELKEQYLILDKEEEVEPGKTVEWGDGTGGQLAGCVYLYISLLLQPPNRAAVQHPGNHIHQLSGFETTPPCSLSVFISGLQDQHDGKSTEWPLYSSQVSGQQGHTPGRVSGLLSGYLPLLILSQHLIRAEWRITVRGSDLGSAWSGCGVHPEIPGVGCGPGCRYRLKGLVSQSEPMGPCQTS